MWHQDERIPLWRNFSFTLMWTSAAASGFGDRMMMLAALALLGAMGGSAESTSIYAATQFSFMLPYFVFGLGAGWLADHLPRKWIMLGCDESRAGILLLAYFMLVPVSLASGAIPPDQQWKVMGVLFMVGTFAATFNPARTAIVPQLLPPKQLTAGNAVLISITVIASMIGAVVGDWIIDPQDAGTVKSGLLIAVFIYAVSGTFFIFLRLHDQGAVRRPARDRTLHQAAIYIFQHRRVIQLTVLHALVWGVAFLIYTAPLAIGKIKFGFEDAALQTHFVWMTAMVGIGMLAGAGVVAAIGTRREASLPMMLSLVLAGVCIFGVVNAPWYWLTMLCTMLAGLFGNVTIISVITLLQSITPNYIRGRVMGLDAMNTTFTSLVVTLSAWKMPLLGFNSDNAVLIMLDITGPVMALWGAVLLWRVLRRGPMPSPAANVFRNLERWFCLVWHRLQWRGRHHIPSTGPVIFASNHTTALDPLLLQAASPRMIRWLMLTSYRFKLLNPLWNAIDPICLEYEDGQERAEPGIRQVRQIVNELKTGAAAGIFPEGHLQYDHRNLDEFQLGAAVCARLSGAQIVPCWIEGTPRSKSMFVHLFKPTRCRVSFGEPMTVAKGTDPAEATAELRRRMLALSSEANAAG